MKLFFSVVYFGYAQYKTISKSMRQSAVLEETLISEWGENKFSETIEFFLHQMNLRMENQVGEREKAQGTWLFFMGAL